MDLGFFRRAGFGVAAREAAPLDYGMLLTTLSAFQAASATGRAERSCAGAGPAFLSPRDPLVTLLLGAPGWSEAVALQCGCFNRGQAERLAHGA